MMTEMFCDVARRKPLAEVVALGLVVATGWAALAS